MDSKSLYLALNEILNATKKEVINWRLSGSANLFIQGVPIQPKDLDIATNPPGIKKFESVLKRFRPVKTFNEKIKCYTLTCKISGVEVEIASYEDQRAMLDKTRPIYWSKLVIPGLDLDDSKNFYNIIQNQEKINLIDKFLFTKSQK